MAQSSGHLSVSILSNLPVAFSMGIKHSLSFIHFLNLPSKKPFILGLSLTCWQLLVSLVHLYLLFHSSPTPSLHTHKLLLSAPTSQAPGSSQISTLLPITSFKSLLTHHLSMRPSVPILFKRLPSTAR